MLLLIQIYYLFTTTMKPHLFLPLQVLAIIACTITLKSVPTCAQGKKLLFGMASGGSSFYDAIRLGWEEACARHSEEVDCEYFAENKTWFKENYPDLANDEANYKPCVAQIRQMIDRGFDGISMYCGEGHPVVEEAKEKGMALTSFDIIPPIPMPFVGTDNYYLGVTMARLLRQLKPTGGTYHVVSFRKKPESFQGFVQEIEKDNHRSDRAHWFKVSTNVSGRPEGDDLINGESLGMSLDGLGETKENYNRTMEKLLDLQPDAILFMYTRPLRFENYTRWREQLRQEHNTVVIGTQASDTELQLMTRKQVDGLIGQLTYDMGAMSFQALYDIKKKQIKIPDHAKIFTQVINYNLVPAALPPIQVDQSLIADLKYVGFTCFAIVALLVALCLAWTLYNSKRIVVRASQPVFLVMTATGVLVMASSIIPLSFDDIGQGYDLDPTKAVAICMTVPWLSYLGFTLTFSALFAKTWRVNKFFQSKNGFERIQVQPKDVLAPFVVLLTLNIVVLTLWTIIDPLTYIREFQDGTDLYNREIASNGRCRSNNAAAYLIPLALLNFFVLVIACWQAAHARNIQSEFAEAKYIGLTVFSLAQAFVTGIPIVVVVKDIPEAFYLVLTFLIFILSMVILLLIFLPKVFMQRKYNSMSEVEQRRALAVSIRSSSMAKLSLSDSQNNISRTNIRLLNLERQEEMQQRHQQERELVVANSEKDKDNDVNAFDGASGLRSERYQLGSMVERVDDSLVIADKHSTYATEELANDSSTRLDAKVAQKTMDASERSSALKPPFKAGNSIHVTEELANDLESKVDEDAAPKIDASEDAPALELGKHAL